MAQDVIYGVITGIASPSMMAMQVTHEGTHNTHNYKGIIKIAVSKINGLGFLVSQNNLTKVTAAVKGRKVIATVTAVVNGVPVVTLTIDTTNLTAGNNTANGVWKTLFTDINALPDGLTVDNTGNLMTATGTVFLYYAGRISTYPQLNSLTPGSIYQKNTTGGTFNGGTWYIHP